MKATRHDDYQRAYLRDHAWAFSIAIVALLTGASAFFFPSLIGDASVAQLLPGSMELIWTLFKAIGAGLVLYGIYRAEPEWEVPGLILLATCFSINAVAVADIRGLDTLWASSVIPGAALGAAVRAYFRATRLKSGG